MMNVVLVFVMLGAGLMVVMCVDCQWFRSRSPGERRRHARQARVGLGKP